jgi:Flp pilus assembly pilin Flp
MKILEDESGQGAAEYMLIFGGVIVIVIVAAIYYQNYLNKMGQDINETDVQNINNSLNDLMNNHILNH